MDVPDWLAGLETRIAKVLVWQRIESQDELIRLLERGDDIPRIREYSRGRIQAWLSSGGAANATRIDRQAASCRKVPVTSKRRSATILEQTRARQASALFERVTSHMNWKSDAALCKATGISASAISKARNGLLPVGAGMLIRLHEETGIPIRELKAFLSPLE